jgi:hypothetical protein
MHPSRQDDVTFWLVAWLAIALSGSLYGLAVLVLLATEGPGLGVLIFFFIPLIVGFFIAGVFAVPFLLTVAVTTWGLWLSRFRMLAAAIAGGWTGVMAARSVFGHSGGGRWPVDPVALAGIFGAVGCPLLVYLLGRRYFFFKRKNDAPPTPWQFTLRELFVHFTVLAVLISLWSWYFTAAAARDADELRRSNPPDAAAPAQPAASAPQGG